MLSNMRVHWRLSECPRRLKSSIQDRLAKIRIIYLSLCYNQFTSWNTVMDTSMEPMFWMVDKSARFIGPVFVTFVVVMTTMVVMTFYVCILPHIYYQTDMFWSIVHLIFSHWLLINVVFNYAMASFTTPGHPPQALTEVVSICKKCIAPKPPRTHHCTICNACVLRMDHHCPWLNNCVGFYNHRYFFQYVCFMFFGCIYGCIVGHDIFRQHFFGNKDLIVPAFFFPINMAYHMWSDDKNKDTAASSTEVTSEVMSESEVMSTLDVQRSFDELDWKVDYKNQFLHNTIIIEFLLCMGVSVALGLLGMWHARLISKGQTSVEQHINDRERARCKKKGRRFINPYDFGFRKNWEIFFGLTKGRTFVRHVLFPSRHDPEGSGLTWHTRAWKVDSNRLLDLL